MVSESLFGMLTAAGITMLPYFLLLRPLVLGEAGALGGIDSGVGTAIFLLVFSAVPMAVAQTQTSLANGSRFYATETWVPALAGLLAQAAVLGLFFLTGGIPATPTTPSLGGVPKPGGNEFVLLIGSAAIVPLFQMVAINFFKQPKFAF